MTGTVSGSADGPRVAVIVPCYNYAHYLPETLASILAQSRAPDDVLVVDDGSTDDTAAVARRFAPGVRCIRQANGGLSAARNRGIAETDADVLAFIDADDLWTSEFLATLLPRLVDEPGLGAVFGGARYVDEAGRDLAQQALRSVAGDELHDLLVDGEFFPAHAVLVRRACFEAVGVFDESLSASEDWDMWLRISARFPFAGVSEVVALYRLHGENMSKDLGRMHATQMAVVAKNFGPDEGDPATWPSERRRAYAGVYLWRAMAHHRYGQPEAGHADTRRAASLWPALVTRLDTWYSLGCADQPMGELGNLAALDLDAAARRVTTALARVFEPPLPDDLQALRSGAGSVAYQALARLAWGQGNAALARHWLVRAARSRPALVGEAPWLADTARALAGRRMVAVTKRLRVSR
jgi:glycosyltransferase involved in cell wall biosynthesis